MDHSIYGYLQRRTTEELHNILSGYLDMRRSEYEEEVVRMILEILEKRKNRVR